MKRSIILAGVVLAFCYGVSAQTSSACLCVTTEAAQKYCMSERSGLPKTEIRIAQEKIAKRDIQRPINNGIGADEAKDESASGFNFTKDFTIKDLDGRVWTTEEMKGRKGASGQHYDQILKVSDRTKIAIECLTLKGAEATVYTNQHFVRYVPDRKDGSPHEVITNILHREVWVFTEDGWKCKFIEELERGGTFLNGQPYKT